MDGHMEVKGHVLYASPSQGMLHKTHRHIYVPKHWSQLNRSGTSLQLALPEEYVVSPLQCCLLKALSCRRIPLSEFLPPT